MALPAGGAGGRSVAEVGSCPAPPSPGGAPLHLRVRPRPLTVQRARDSLLPRALAPLVPGAVARGPRADRAGRPLLYLTVDDGPDPKGTPRWLDGLARHDAHAVFFLSGPRAERHPALVRRIVDAGHRVGNHGWAHVSAWRARPSSVRAGMERAERVLEDLAGGAVRDVRPPYGRVTPDLVRWCRAGRRLVLWDLMPGDYLAGRSAEALAAETVALARAGSVAVLHDGAPAGRAVAALDLAAPRLARAGWRFPALPPRPAP